MVLRVRGEEEAVVVVIIREIKGGDCGRESVSMQRKVVIAPGRWRG